MKKIIMVSVLFSFSSIFSLESKAVNLSCDDHNDIISLIVRDIVKTCNEGFKKNYNASACKRFCADQAEATRNAEAAGCYLIWARKHPYCP